MADRPEFAVVMADAESVAFGPTGAAATVTDAYRAYTTAVSRGAEAQPHLEWVLVNGSPAGRVYAAAALHEVEPLRGEHALAALEADETPVRLVEGCAIFDSTVGEVARERRSKVPPPATGFNDSLVAVLWIAVPLGVVAYAIASCV